MLDGLETIGFKDTTFKCLKCGHVFHGNELKPLNMICPKCKSIKTTLESMWKKFQNRDDVCKHASPQDRDGTRLCVNPKSKRYLNTLCPGVHACGDGEVLKVKICAKCGYRNLEHDNKCQFCHQCGRKL